jgi:hypothetical protein
LRPWLERLEDRTLLSTFDIVGGQASYLASPGVANELTISRQGPVLVISDLAETISLTDAARMAGCSGDGTHTVLCPVASINAVNVNTSGPANLVVDDSADTAPRTVVLDANSVTGLGPAPIHFNPGALAGLTLNGGSGGNRFTVVNTGADFLTTVNTGTGPNVVKVQGTIGALAINGLGGSDQVTVGGGTLANIRGAVFISNFGPLTDLTVDGSGDTAATHGLFSNDGTNGQISGADPTPLGQFPGLADPAAPLLPVVANVPVTVNYQDGALRSLTIDGGSGGNIFAVAGTGPGFTTTLNSGTGADIVMVQATTGTLALDGQDGRDQVILGQWQSFPNSLFSPGSTLSGLQGAVSVSNDRSLTDLFVDGSGDAFANFQLDSAPGSGKSHISVSGVSNFGSPYTADITSVASEVNSLKLRGGFGTSFLVNDPSVGPPTTVTTGSFNTVNVLQAGGPVTVLDADGSALVTASNAPHFEHVISHGTLQPDIASDFSFTASADGTLASPTDVDLFRVDVPPGLDVQPPLDFNRLLGVLTVTVTPRNGSTFDSRVALSSADSFLFVNGASSAGGGLLGFSAGSSGAAGPSVTQYVYPGPYYIRVSSGGGGGDYTVNVHFTPNPVLPYVTDPFVTNSVGQNPQDIALGDFNRDGVIDLAVANHDSGDVSVLLGVGDASFLPEVRYPVFPGDHPDRIIGVDFNHDGRPDLAVLDATAGYVDILLGLGDGTFQPPDIPHHLSLQMAQANPDLTNLFSAPVSTALSRDNTTLLGVHGQVVNADFNGDGSLDTAQLFADSNNPGTFLGVTVVATVDLNAKGFLQYPPVNDLLGGPTPVSNVVAKVLNNGGGVVTQQDISAPSRATPIVADLNGDGVPDVVEVNRAGFILFRAGIAGQPGTFAPPKTLNGPEDLAREITLVGNDPLHPQIAAIAVGSNRVFVLSGQVDPATHDVTWTRTFDESTGDVFRPARIAAGDLNGDGQADLVVADSFLGSLAIYLNQGGGTFRRARDVKAGITLSDLTLSDPQHDGHADLIVTDEVSGDVSIFPNLRLPAGQVGFGDELRFRAGAPALGFGIDESVVSSVANELADTQLLPALAPGLTPAQLSQYLSFFGINLPLFPDAGQFFFDPQRGFAELFPPVLFTFSQLGTSAVTLADLDGTGVPDLVVLNRTAKELVILRPKLGSDGKPTGSFLDPQPADILATGAGPEAVVTGHFTADGELDLAVLNTADHTIWVYTQDSSGRLTHTFSADAGTTPTGLSVADINQDGIPDLLVGNTFGDLLVLLGKGDGTFQPPPFTGDRTQLAQTTAGNDKQPKVLVTDQLNNRITIQVPTSSGTQFTTVNTLAPPQQADFAPGAVQFAKLDPSSPFPDAVVVASGSNAVLVYRFAGFDASGQPIYAPPVSYSVGTNPAGLTIADVNGDGIPDLVVANQGSNDVSVLFGAYDDNGQWMASPGPRLQSGGIGPIAVTVRDVTGSSGTGGPDGILDLVVTNAQRGTMTVLPGVGGGFFDDNNPQVVLSLGGTPTGPPSTTPSGSSVVGVGNQLVGFDLGNLAAGASTLFTFPEPVDAAEVLANGEVVVALEGGTVEELLPDGSGGLTTVTLTPLTGIPADPSALEVLESGEVLVTNAGEDQVFVFSAPGVPEIRLPAPSLPTSPEAVVTASPEAPLTPVVVLVPSDVPPGELAHPTDAEVLSFRAVDSTPLVASDTTGRFRGEEQEESEEEEDVVPQESDSGIDVDNALRQLDLYRRTEDPDASGPLTHQNSSAAPVPWEMDLVIFWEADGDVLSLPARNVPVRSERSSFSAYPAMLEDAFTEHANQPPDQVPLSVSPREIAFAAPETPDETTENVNCADSGASSDTLPPRRPTLATSAHPSAPEEPVHDGEWNRLFLTALAFGAMLGGTQECQFRGGRPAPPSRGTCPPFGKKEGSPP